MRVINCLFFLLCFALAGCDNGDGGLLGGKPSNPDVVMTALQVTPMTASVAAGFERQFVATAIFSDGTSQDVTTAAALSWSSSAPSVATIGTDTGLATGITPDVVTITASGSAGGEAFTASAELTVTNAVVTALQVTPSPVYLIKGNTQQLIAVAMYSDSTSSDVTNSVTWTPVDTAISTVTSGGLLSGVEVGSTTLTASKDGITSNLVNVNVCSSLAGICIDIFDTGGGKLFTNSPSVTYLDSIGGSLSGGTFIENGTLGPAGNFYVFNWNNANILCATYNTHSIGGRTNWRLATRDELKVELYDVSGSMFTARGWPTTFNYWSSTPDGSDYYTVHFSNGYITSFNPLDTRYTSCVSVP